MIDENCFYILDMLLKAFFFLSNLLSALLTPDPVHVTNLFTISFLLISLLPTVEEHGYQRD